MRSMTLYSSSTDENTTADTLAAQSPCPDEPPESLAADTETGASLIRVDFIKFVDYLVQSCHSINSCICNGLNNQKSRIELMADNILHMAHAMPDASLAVMHYYYTHPHSALHPVYSAILSARIAETLGSGQESIHSLTCAAISANLGMFRNFDTLTNSTDKLSDEEHNILKAHPAVSCELLQNNNVDDTLWLQIVMQHHERPDGTGYPHGLADPQICAEAKILGMVDTYLALIMPRAYRQALLPGGAMKKLYTLSIGSNEQLSSALIKVLGIFPPGSLVKLDNEETAMVYKRNPDNSLQPVVAALYNKKDKFYDKPILRDTANPVFKIISPARLTIKNQLLLHDLWNKDDKLDLRLSGEARPC